MRFFRNRESFFFRWDKPVFPFPFRAKFPKKIDIALREIRKSQKLKDYKITRLQDFKIERLQY
jgi:hypothetical protein